MATIPQYIDHMRSRQAAIANQMGSDLTAMDKQHRVMNLSLMAFMAVIMKTLVDAGVITDAQLLATLNAARDGTYPDEP